VSSASATSASKAIERPRSIPSDQRRAAWRARELTEDAVGEIAKQFDESPAKVVAAHARSSGVRLSLAYDGDDVPICGNDITFWLRWHLQHGGVVKPPKIIINGIPFPDIIRLELDFGDVPAPVEIPQQLGFSGPGA